MLERVSQRILGAAQGVLRQRTASSPPTPDAHAEALAVESAIASSPVFPEDAPPQEPGATGGSQPEQARERESRIRAWRRRVLLRKGERMYSRLGDNAGSCSFAMLDETGVVIAWRGMHDERAQEAEATLGRHVSQFYVPEDVSSDRPERALRAAAAEGGSTQEGWHVRPGGGVFWGARVIEAIVLRDGRVQGFSIVTRKLSGPTAGFARRDDETDRDRRQALNDAT